MAIRRVAECSGNACSESTQLVARPGPNAVHLLTTADRYDPVVPSAPSDLIDEELRTFIIGPVSSLLGTADRLHTPDATRVAGIAPISPLRVRVLISTEATAARSNASVGARCSLLVTDITTYRSIQWKGAIALAAHERTAGDVALMHRHIDAFEAGAERIHLLDGVAFAMFPVDVVALELDLDARYDQTPGPHAGMRMR